MRKILVIVMISIHLLGNTEVGQLFHMPQLLAHFFQHHRQDPTINFFDFLAMHYSGDDGTTADDDFDKQLPWHNANQHTIGLSYSPMVKDILLIQVPAYTNREYNSQLLAGVSSKHVLLILQPPRLV